MHNYDEKIAEYVAKLGLPTAEARLYSFLLKNSGLNLREISKRINVSVPRVYKLLYNLKLRGLVVVSQYHRSKTYSVVPPAVAASILARSFEEQFYKALSLRDELLKELRKMGQQYLSSNLLSEYSDRHTIMYVIKSLVEESKNELMAVLTVGCLIRFVYAFKDEFRGAASRGVKIFILAPFSKAPYGVILEATRWGECREVNEVNAKILLKDAEEAFLIPGKGTLNERVAYECGVHVRNRDIVSTLRQMFTSLWYSSRAVTLTCST